MKRCASKKIKSIETDDKCSELAMQGMVESLCFVVLTIWKRGSFLELPYILKDISFCRSING